MDALTMSLVAFLGTLFGVSIALALMRMWPGVQGVIGQTVTPLAISIVALILTLQSAGYCYLGQMSGSWTEVQGLITQSYVRHVRSGRSNRTTDYRAEVEYTYSVMGRTYTNDRLTFSADQGYPGHNYTDNRARAEAIVANYPAQLPVPITYNPKNPAMSVLHPGLRRTEAVALGVACGAGFAALLSFLLTATDPRNRAIVQELLYGGDDDEDEEVLA